MVPIILSVLTVLFTIVYLFVVLYLLKGWRRIKKYDSPQTYIPKTRVSVLIAARNEEDNIAATIEALLAQDYPAHLFEIIIVDDHSTDATASIITSYREQGIKLLQLNEERPLNSYKKKAITEAIGLATGELIVTTDADCSMNPFWLSTIISFYEKNDYYLVSAPVVYFDEKTMFEELQTLEFLYLIGLGAGMIGNTHPSTCNGANLAYRRDIFYELKGFQGIDQLASGDDELFLHKVAAKDPQKIGFCKSREATVYTSAKKNLASFISQRKRWASKSTHYKRKSIVVLGAIIWSFNVFICFSIITAFLNPFYWSVVYSCLAVKLIAELLFMVPMCRFADRLKLLWYLPLLSILHIFYLIFIGIAGNSGAYQWKGRTVR